MIERADETVHPERSRGAIRTRPSNPLGMNVVGGVS